MATTTRYCRCDLRYKAEADRSLVFDPASNAYVMPEAPLRSMSAKARYLAFHERSEFSHVDHSGEHYTYVVCCHCGGDLPGTQLEPPRFPDPDAEG